MRVPIDLNPQENAALDKALEEYRKSTGQNLSKAYIGRDGFRQFCQAMKVEWPERADRWSAERG